MHRLIKFSLVGLMLFIVDYIFFAIFFKYFGAHISRLISMVISAFIGWHLNRNYTFNDRKKKPIIREFFYYYLVVIINSTINYSISIYLIKNFTNIPTFISIGSACILGSFLNFSLLDKFTYR
jgi:putative flippase GtrA